MSFILSPCLTLGTQGQECFDTTHNPLAGSEALWWGRGVRVETVCWNIRSKPQNMPKNNKDINHGPKGWWNSIFTSPSTSKHEHAIPEGMEGASNTRSRENARRRAGLGKKSSNFYTSVTGKIPHKWQLETFFTSWGKQQACTFQKKDIKILECHFVTFFQLPPSLHLHLMLFSPPSLHTSLTGLLSVLQMSHVYPHLRTVLLVIPSTRTSSAQIFAGCLLLLFKSRARCHLLRHIP